MKDLANEREAIIRKISEFNFEPVNAESWLPDGSKSWERISRELLSSHLFVLVVGDRYGWVPEEGPGAGDGLSVTHMEVNAARAASIPILPFLKRLDYDCDRDSDDARKRDAFRKEVARWGTGQFIAHFELAFELSGQVGAALVNVLSESYLNLEVQKRSTLAIPIAESLLVRRPEHAPLEPGLVNIVRARKAILLAGAGMSLRAGFPSARALTEVLAARILDRYDDFSNSALTGSFQDVAENFELAYGRQALLGAVQKALSAPQGVQPTRAHRLAVALFRVVLTTNFDCLFEAACGEAGMDYAVMSDDSELVPDLDKTVIVKLDGSISTPQGLVLTARDAWDLRRRKPKLWRSLALLMKTAPIIVVGHSLRDANTKALLQLRDGGMPGYIVAPDLGSFDVRRFDGLGLRSVRSEAEGFLEEINEKLGTAV